MLPSTFYIGGYWRGPNDMVRQMMLGLRAAGAEVYEFNTDLNPEALECDGRPYDRGTFGPVWLRWDVLRPAMEEFRPGLIVCNAGGLSFRPDVAAVLRRSAMLLGSRAQRSRCFCSHHQQDRRQLRSISHQRSRHASRVPRAWSQRERTAAGHQRRVLSSGSLPRGARLRRVADWQGEPGSR